MKTADAETASRDCAHMGALQRHKALSAIWATPPGLGRLAAVNHSTVGRRFIVTACVFFAIGGLLAMLLRAQLATPRSVFIGPDVYNQVFTMHGTVMMFLFAIPLIEGFALYLLPKILGARDLAFPRLSAYGYWCYVFGGALLIVALLTGFAPDSGWFMYTPLSSRPFSPGINSDVWLLGVTFVEISAVCAAVEIVVTILKVRAPGMTLDQMPLLAWYILVTAFMMLVGFPPLILASILLELERAFDLPFFDPDRGGDALLWQHLFWLFGHPEVYIIFIPAAGMISTILPVFARRDMIGYNWIVVSVIALGFISFGLWVHHMFVVGIPHLGLAFFSAASLLVVVPTAVQIFAWLGTMALGRPRLDLPMRYVIGFFVIFVIGGLTGVMVAIVPFDSQVHDTHFVVAHLHYVLIGGFVFPMLGGVYYWLPLLCGRQARYPLGLAGFWLIFIGFNITFLVMHLTGLLGMPRRVFTYSADTQWELPNLVSSFGSFVMAFGFAIVAVDVTLQARHGILRRRNTWGAATLDWATPRPVPSYNFASLPHVQSRTPLRDDGSLGVRLARGEGYAAIPRNAWPETLSVDMTSARPDAVLVLPRPTFLPLVTALATAMFFLGMLFQLYAAAIAGIAAVIVSALFWTRSTGDTRNWGPLPIGRGQAALPHWEIDRPPSWWAMVFTLVANGALFMSLIFGVVFLATIARGWPPPLVLEGGWISGLVAVTAMVSAGVLATSAVRLARRSMVLATAALALTAVLQVVACAGLVDLMVHIPQPTAHAYGASCVALLGYTVAHAGLGLVFAGHGLWRIWSGHATPGRLLDLRIGSLWHAYTAATGVAAVAVVVGLSQMAAP